MSQHFYRIGCWIALCWFLVGCNQASETVDSGFDSETDALTDTVGDTAVVSGTDSGAFKDSETVSETGTDSTLVVIQGPTTLRVVNQSDQPVYFSAYSGAASLFSCEDSAGDPCQLFDFGCMMACDEVTADDYCGIACDFMPAMVKVAAGEERVVEWDGYMRQQQLNYCKDGGACYQRIQPKQDTYTISARAFGSINCWDPTACAPDDQGIIWGAEPVGESVTITASLLVPSVTGAVLVVQ